MSDSTNATPKPPKVQQGTCPDDQFWNHLVPQVLQDWQILLMGINSEVRTHKQRQVLLDLNTLFAIWADHGRDGGREVCTFRSKFEAMGQDWAYWKKHLMAAGFHLSNRIPAQVLKENPDRQPDVALWIETEGLPFRTPRPLLPEEEEFFREIEASRRAMEEESRASQARVGATLGLQPPDEVRPEIADLNTVMQ